MVNWKTKLVKEQIEPVIGTDKVKDIGYRIVSDPDVSKKGIARWGQMLKHAVNALRGKPIEIMDDNKYGYFYGMDSMRERENSQVGFDYNAYLDEYYPDKKSEIHSYKGIIHPKDTFYVDAQNKAYLDSLANVNGHLYFNADEDYLDYVQEKNPDIFGPEYSDAKWLDVGYRDDVHNYIAKFRKDYKGNIVMDASDLYDFEPEHYSEQFGKKWQAELMSEYGTPYILRQNNIPVKFINVGENLRTKPIKTYYGYNYREEMSDEEKMAGNVQSQLDDIKHKAKENSSAQKITLTPTLQLLYNPGEYIPYPILPEGIPQ